MVLVTNSQKRFECHIKNKKNLSISTIIIPAGNESDLQLDNTGVGAQFSLLSI